MFRVQGFRGSGVQGFRGSGVQGSGQVQGLKDEAKGLDVRASRV